MAAPPAVVEARVLAAVGLAVGPAPVLALALVVVRRAQRVPLRLLAR